ncbi:60S ribosomal protein L4-A [Sphaeroforma arctica JP610]|uniref:60S ribosomal protein L4-A n=1 Tax=Sphaeroforma arctica JP610 TaxID=667725 RepID=A0A0L0GDS1_9EUKA|nr:60S ribosomal protein L4-A [Sphaeroforma arctica JP610]KNC87145.1 60S ribosomal protein L4-A [Sphaeroforma arctica JP610]|eukprot:XP_014161047.1 60S ribosomal protein L4-A [Sphaeroforma arctica JP610]
MASRPVVSVIGLDGSTSAATNTLPAVFRTNIRPDVVRDVHTSMNKNNRQAYSVSKEAGHQTSAESWGTGRAVARIPRVAGGGTHRAGQAAFGNMCRSGRMFAPTKVWRKWHKKINQNQRRYATASALAASAIPALLMARGHTIDNVPEVPLVIANDIEGLAKTKAAVELMKKVGAYDDVEKCANSRKVRSGKGKLRNRRHVMKRGPLVVYKSDNGLTKAFRNIPGVELCNVERLNLLQLAPGGHVGRFIIWTEGAFSELDAIWGTFRSGSQKKSGYTLPKSIMSNPDITRIINSDEVQSQLKEAKEPARRLAHRKNPLANANVMLRMNPYVKQSKRHEMLTVEKRQKAKAEKKQTQRAKSADIKALGKKFIGTMVAE